MSRVSAGALLAVLVAGAIASPHARAADITVLRRSGTDPVICSEARATEQGLEVVGNGPGAAAGSAGRSGEPRSAISRQLLPWDMVASVSGVAPDAPWTEAMAPAEDLWRARIRIERGDHRLAEPLLLQHWDRFSTKDGPTSALVAEGLLRCTLARGDLRSAVEPWIVSLRLGMRGEASRFPKLPSSIDLTTGLIPALPPFVPAALRSDLLAACDAVDERIGGAEATSVATAFGAILRATGSERGGAPTAPAEPAAAENAVATELLRQLLAIVEAPDPRERDRATERFDLVLRGVREGAAEAGSGSIGAWRLAASATNAARLARALAPDDPERPRALELAALEFLEVPAGELDGSGLVDCFAFEEAEALLREAGDPAAAAQLKTLLGERLRRASARTGGHRQHDDHAGAPGAAGSNP